METNSNQSSSVPKLVVGIVAILVCCACALIVGAAFVLYQATQSAPFDPTPFELPADSTAIPQPTVEIERPDVGTISTETLETLETANVPPNEPLELACRMGGKCDVPAVIVTSAAPRVIGDKDNFWVSNLDTNEHIEVQATLRYITPHAYFWVQDGVSYDDVEVKTLMDAFETKIYPTDREFFGSEWSPGIDGDVHIYILYTRGLGSSVAGYFSSADSVHPLVHEFSNGHEMFLFNADNTSLDQEFTYGVLAHEFQHMIHWNQDLNETSWINEGFSEVAAFINGYDPGGFDSLYISDPDLQLNDWPNDQNATSPHYGSGFLFLTYFLDRFGEDATKALVKDPANGFDSVDNVLREINANDPVTGQPITADDFFTDWVVTNYLLDKSVGDGRYVYDNYPDASRAVATETINRCPQAAFTREVHEYGVDYIAIECEGDYTLSFSGSMVTGLLPADPYSGDYAFWSNKGDSSDMTLTRDFDFTGVSGPIELSFRTWYDIETDWDYIYLEVSEDGKTWQIITTPSGTDTDPSGNSYGWGYTGVTNDWVEEKVDLSQFAGRKISVRFEYVTDANVHGEGFLLDDIQVEAINYQSDFEADEGGWEAAGFVRVENALPQTYRLSLILKGDTTTVTNIQLNADQTVDIPLSLQNGEEAILIVSGTTRFTRQPAAYQIEIK